MLNVWPFDSAEGSLYPILSPLRQIQQRILPGVDGRHCETRTHCQQSLGQLTSCRVATSNLRLRTDRANACLPLSFNRLKNERESFFPFVSHTEVHELEKLLLRI